MQVSRAESDAFAARSHQRAAAATAAELLAAEIAPVEVPQRRGDPLVVGADEGVRAGVTAEALAGLRPAFGPDGIITAASSSPISDGAAALVVASAEAAERLGPAGARRDRRVRQVAGPDSSLQLQPAEAIEVAAQGAGIAIADLDLIEINEAFAAVGVGQRPRPRPERGRDRRAGQRARWGDRARPPDRRLRARGWCCTWRTSCSGGAAAPRSPPCAAAAVRATP